MSTQPRPLFIYGTLCAKPLLAWVLTGDASKVALVSRLVFPAIVSGFARWTVKCCDYPANVRQDTLDATVQGYILQVETTTQRQKLDDFEGGSYKSISVSVHLIDDDGSPQNKTIEADMYLWNGDTDALSSQPWKLDDFITERLEDWLDLFDGMEMIGD